MQNTMQPIVTRVSFLLTILRYVSFVSYDKKFTRAICIERKWYGKFSLQLGGHWPLSYIETRLHQANFCCFYDLKSCSCGWRLREIYFYALNICDRILLPFLKEKEKKTFRKQEKIWKKFDLYSKETKTALQIERIAESIIEKSVQKCTYSSTLGKKIYVKS